MQYKATALAAQKRGTENVGGNGDEADASSIHVFFLSPTAETENMGKFGFGYVFWRRSRFGHCLGRVCDRRDNHGCVSLARQPLSFLVLG